jgi:hypothetical protein
MVALYEPVAVSGPLNRHFRFSGEDLLGGPFGELRVRRRAVPSCRFTDRASKFRHSSATNETDDFAPCKRCRYWHRAASPWPQGP